MIEAHVDVKTTDGYLLRLFCVGFTKKRTNQIRKTSYAQHQQVRQIRKKMMEIMTREVQTNDLKEVVNKLYVWSSLLIHGITLVKSEESGSFAWGPPSFIVQNYWTIIGE